ncbi:alcohol dehydrogenase catalytic domain-containing protein [Streptomyces sp. SBT349]|uniref:alcohol dehydrogenase catalytic domain-containing protein n=1 Tax=Streptomyces sp. SBT349 TaxID=1580539 RepID=UPI00069F3F4E|nr:alcohol dehydrogenase catalytic domain-containing protein [Streptomyces sp. SBT349]
MALTYRAVQFSEYGDPEVLVRVRAAGVNPIDWKVRAGAFAATMPVEFPVVPGGDVAGVVEEIGDGVGDLAVGDEVFGAVTSGGYAELALVPVGQLARKPEGVPWEVAAGLPKAVTAGPRGS